MIDEETLSQMERLERGTRPLIVCDVDEVILHFVEPFGAFLDHKGWTFTPRSYRLTGNIHARDGGAAATQEQVWALLGDFFAAQHEWQTPIADAREELHALGDQFDIVLLTAMPHAYRDTRKRFMAGLGLDQPLLTVESDKGPAVARLAHARPFVAFIDDLAPNHHSVFEHHPETHLHQFMAFRGFDGELPAAPAHARYHEEWPAMAAAIRSGLG
ncbi:MAG: hypothetical protein MUC58_00050 [Rhizobiaceae bacterium]|jgi:hypothetical protein|nr:hypothetical protein [Rhizobiaceae bacterium]